MHFKVKRKVQLLNISDDFATLRRVGRSGRMYFNFFYKISPSKAVEHNAFIVRVSVYSSIEYKKSITENSTQVGNIDTKKMINDIIMQITNLKNLNSQQNYSLVATKNSDISSKINNSIISQLKAKVPLEDIQQLKSTKLELVPLAKLQTDAQIVPVFQFSSQNLLPSSSITENPTKLINRSI